MMKRLTLVVVLVLSVSVTAGCGGDSLEGFQDQELELINELAEILADVEDEDDLEDAAEDLEAWAEDWEAYQEAYEEWREALEEEFEEPREEAQEALEEAAESFGESADAEDIVEVLDDLELDELEGLGRSHWSDIRWDRIILSSVRPTAGDVCAHFAELMDVEPDPEFMADCESDIIVEAQEQCGDRVDEALRCILEQDDLRDAREACEPICEEDQVYPVGAISDDEICACDNDTIRETCETTIDACDGNSDCLHALAEGVAASCEATGAAEGEDGGRATGTHILAEANNADGGQTMRLAGGFGPIIQEGQSGGSSQASVHGNGCAGVIASTPDHIISVAGTVNAVFAVTSDADTTLVITGAGGPYCNDDNDGLNPGLTASLVAGTYNVYIGNWSAHERGARYSLIVSESPAVQRPIAPPPIVPPPPAPPAPPTGMAPTGAVPAAPVAPIVAPTSVPSRPAAAVAVPDSLACQTACAQAASACARAAGTDATTMQRCATTAQNCAMGCAR